MTDDGRRLTDARIHARAPVAVGRKKKNTHHEGTKDTKGKNHREDGEAREETFHHKGTKGTKGEMLRKKFPGAELSHP
jgi:hypothetical protein